MPLVNLMEYQPKILKLESEGQIVELLKEVRREISGLEYQFEDKSLIEVLKVVESGEYQCGGNGFRNRIDLKPARDIISIYRHLSEKGCESCEHKVLFKPAPDDGWNYCGLHERDDSVGPDRPESHMFKSFRNHGCEDKRPNFRPLSEVLGEVNSK